MLPVPELLLLKTRKHRGRSRLEEGDDHQREGIRRQIAIGCSYDIDLLCPVLEEHAHDVETLIKLTVVEY